MPHARTPSPPCPPHLWRGTPVLEGIDGALPREDEHDVPAHEPAHREEDGDGEQEGEEGQEGGASPARGAGVHEARHVLPAHGHAVGRAHPPARATVGAGAGAVG